VKCSDQKLALLWEWQARSLFDTKACSRLCHPVDWCLQERCRAPELLLIWLFHLGPTRLLLAALVIAGARVAAAFELGPVYRCLAIIITIFTHLGSKKKRARPSAYSVFNPGCAAPAWLSSEC